MYFTIVQESLFLLIIIKEHMIVSKCIILLAYCLSTICCWDTEDLEIFDLVEEVDSNFYSVLGVAQVSVINNTCQHTSVYSFASNAHNFFRMQMQLRSAKPTEDFHCSFIRIKMMLQMRKLSSGRFVFFRNGLAYYLSALILIIFQW